MDFRVLHASPRNNKSLTQKTKNHTRDHFSLTLNNEKPFNCQFNENGQNGRTQSRRGQTTFFDTLSTSVQLA